MAAPISLLSIPVRMVGTLIIMTGMCVRHGLGRMRGVHSSGLTVPHGRGHIPPLGLIIPVGHTILGIPIIVPIIGMAMDIAGMTTIITMAIPDILDILDIPATITDTIIIMPTITREHIAQVDPTRAGRQTLVPVATTMVAPKDIPADLAVIAVTPDIAATPVAPLRAAPAVRLAIAPLIIPSKALPSIAVAIAVATTVATAVSELPVVKRLRATTAILLSLPALRAVIA